MKGNPTLNPPLFAYAKCPISDWIFFSGLAADIPANTRWTGQQVDKYTGNPPVKWVQFQNNE
jgi:hypothetical protein